MDSQGHLPYKAIVPRGLKGQGQTAPVTYIDPLHLGPAAVSGVDTSSAFYLTSCPSGPDAYPASEMLAYPPGAFSDAREFGVGATAASGCLPVSTSEHTFPTPVTSSLLAYDVDAMFEFLADDVLSSDASPDMSFVTSNAPDQGHPQEPMELDLLQMDMTLCSPGMMNAIYPDPLWDSRLLTPPPEDYLAEVLPPQFLTTPAFQAGGHTTETKDFSAPSQTQVGNRSVYSPLRRSMNKLTPIRSASERDGVSAENSGAARKTDQPAKVDDDDDDDDDLQDTSKARRDPLYKAWPDRNGWYHCPMVAELHCAHKPTRQKCIYNKYLDSHLRPYRCKFSDRPDCEEARFSSNACLFRHEREAHGLHNHGVNPYLCKFPDCDRARAGNGFPRRWNQRDHMKRVHEFVDDESPKERHPVTQRPKKRERRSHSPHSTPMRRSGSSANSRL